MGRNRFPRHEVAHWLGRFALILLLAACAGRAGAGTTGKIAGKVVDAKGAPLVGASVSIPELRTGAVTDAAGEYTILNVPPGSYEMRFQFLGYTGLRVQAVIVSADQTTRQDATLTESAVQLQEVVVKAERPVVDVNRTSNIQSVTSDEIARLPVQELQDVVNLQAGVVDGHFRGGRLGEVQYQVDGVSVNNSYDNSNSLTLDRSLLEEVQVISGTFDAEYGQANSGVVNAVLKRGSEHLAWNGEAFSGGFVYPGDAGRRELGSFTLRPAAIQNYTLTVSGPVVPLPRTVFLASMKRGLSDGFAYGTRYFEPTDYHRGSQTLVPTGDGAKVPLSWRNQWSGLAKVTNHSLSNIEVGYQAIVNDIDNRNGNWLWRYNPDGLSRQHTYSIVHGLDWTHTLSKSSFYQVTVRQNYFNYNDRLYESLYDSRYDSAGGAVSSPNFENGAILAGVQFTRFHQNTNTFVLKGSYVDQVSQTRQLKAGAELQLPRIEFGPLGNLAYVAIGGVEQLTRKVDEPPDYPGLTVNHPLLASGYAQEQLEWNDLTLRAGMRFDYFDARAYLPGDLANPANSIAGAPAPPPVRASAKSSLAPRLGVSYPVSKDAALYFAYGHFYQMPALGTAFENSNYSVLANLQAGGIDYGVLGNPDVKPEKTVQYQAGFKQAFSERVGVDVTVFYKDIRDLLGVRFVQTYNGAEYAQLSNADFGNVLGFTLAFDLRPRGLFGLSMDYTWQQARGNTSNPRETATRAEANEDPRPRQVALDWDQRHTFNLTASLQRPDDFSASLIARVGSGTPYTPQIEPGFGGALEENSGRKPAGLLVDLRGEKTLPTRGVALKLFARVFNVFDTRFFNGFVFATTGSPYYSRFPITDEGTLNDPTRYYEPRRIEIGLTLAGGRS